MDRTIEGSWDPIARVRPRTAAGRATVTVATLGLLIVGFLVVQPTSLIQAGPGGLVCAGAGILIGLLVRFLEPKFARDQASASGH